MEFYAKRLRMSGTRAIKRSLSLFSFVPPRCSSQSCLLPFRRTAKTQIFYTAFAKQYKSIWFCLVVFTRFSASFVAAMHPQHHITPQAALCRVCVCRRLLIGRLPPCPRHQGCLTSVWPKSRKARKKRAVLNFFPVVSRSQSCSPLRRLRSVPVLRWRVNCRNTAGRSSENKFRRLHLFSCGASGR